VTSDYPVVVVLVDVVSDAMIVVVVVVVVVVGWNVLFKHKCQSTIRGKEFQTPKTMKTKVLTTILSTTFFFLLSLLSSLHKRKTSLRRANQQ